MIRFLGVAALGLALVPTALASGPPLNAQQGGPGLLSPDGKLRFVAIGDGQHTTVESIRTRDGVVWESLNLGGSWGLPTLAYGTVGGLSRDGSTLILENTAFGPVSHFLVVDTKRMDVNGSFDLKGSFSFDALSPDATRLYLIQHVDGVVGGTTSNRYVVRKYDLLTGHLFPGRIADRTQRSWIMKGYAVTRATSADGRWVYTLYASPGGYPFVHALDTVRGVAHCVGIPWTGSQNAPYNMVLSLRNGGRTLAVHWRSGREYLLLDTRTWRLSPPHSFTWWWIPVAVAAALILLGTLRRARRSAPVLAGGGSGPIPALHDAHPESG